MFLPPWVVRGVTDDKKMGNQDFQKCFLLIKNHLLGGTRNAYLHQIETTEVLGVGRCAAQKTSLKGIIGEGILH